MVENNSDNTTVSKTKKQIQITKSDDLWDIHYDSLICKTEKHPFLVAMVYGTLDINCFQYYVIQDALYLHHFADCLRRLSQHPSIVHDASSQQKLKGFAIGAEEAELSLHNSFFQQWNIPTSRDSDEQMPYTLLYTSYMKNIVTTGTYEEGLAVLLPCFWVYGHVGDILLKLRHELGDSVRRLPQYDAWIDMYGGEEFGRIVREYRDMVDVAIRDNITNETLLHRMEFHFHKCCQLEHMFWDQAETCMSWPI